MKFYPKILIIVTITFLLSLFILYRISSNSLIAKPIFIAHAGGGINGLTYLNSLETINHNYKNGYKYFEMDFNWTSDNELVLIHDWKQTYKRLFNNDSEKPPRLEEFLSMKMNFNQTQLSLNQFAEWMREHPDTILIADVKSNNIEGLKKIIKTIESPFSRVIPQMYKLEEYELIKELGFKGQNIMFAMYKTMEINSEIISFLENKKLLAISVQPQKPYFDRILNKFGSRDLPIYTLTINNPEEFKELVNKGVDGAVTDYLYSNQNEFLSHKETVK
ncbi:MAG: hypothetical protein KDI52_10545 [Xanthomonadales bacterium]|nr:hypothetical protein [Xanthomonadales bacterium]